MGGSDDGNVIDAGGRIGEANPRSIVFEKSKRYGVKPRGQSLQGRAERVIDQLVVGGTCCRSITGEIEGILGKEFESKPTRVAQLSRKAVGARIRRCGRIIIAAVENRPETDLEIVTGDGKVI